MEGLQELQKLISGVRDHSDNVWVLGDFNLPKLNWPESLPVFKPDCSHKQVYDFFLSIINNYNFTQVATEPTRQDNILDLFLTTNPTLIMKVNCSLAFVIIILFLLKHYSNPFCTNSKVLPWLNLRFSLALTNCES